MIHTHTPNCCLRHAHRSHGHGFSDSDRGGTRHLRGVHVAERSVTRARTALTSPSARRGHAYLTGLIPGLLWRCRAAGAEWLRAPATCTACACMRAGGGGGRGGRAQAHRGGRAVDEAQLCVHAQGGADRHGPRVQHRLVQRGQSHRAGHARRRAAHRQGVCGGGGVGGGCRGGGAQALQRAKVCRLQAATP